MKSFLRSFFIFFLLTLAGILMTSTPVYAAEQIAIEHGHGGIIFLFLAILIITAKIGGVIEKRGQPGVLGELLAGVALSGLAYFGLSTLAQIRDSEVITFMAELGAIILLFQIGLESNVNKMLKVGASAFIVALIGVIVPFLLGTLLIGPWLFPEHTFVARLFIGASLVATSVGITASVFHSFKALKTRACQTVLGAAVIDDILGLLVLAIVSALASGVEVTPKFITMLTIKAFGFLILAIILGDLLARHASRFFSRLHTGTGMKLGVAMTFALLYAYVATLVGLAPIIGAFAAGLVLDAVHFKDYDVPLASFKLSKFAKRNKNFGKHLAGVIHDINHRHIEDMVAGLGLIFVPIFFVYTGLQIDFASLLNPDLYVSAFIISIVAILGKLVSGLVVNGELSEKLLVGMSMVPRGEVGLIFASVGKAMGAIDTALFSTIVLVIIITTFISPPVINYLLKQRQSEDVKLDKMPAPDKIYS